MFGDSHSGMLDTGVVNFISKPYGITTYTVSSGGADKRNKQQYPLSNFPLPGLTRLSPKKQPQLDLQARAALKETIHMLKQSTNSALMLSFLYSSKLQNSGYLSNHKPLNINPWTMTGYQQYKPLTDALGTLKRKIGRRKMIIIGQSPPASFIPATCLNKLKWFSNSHCTPKQKEDALIENLHINKVLAEFASQHKGVYFLNPYDSLCQSGYCNSLEKNGTPLYADSGHLSKTGSNYLIKRIQKKLIEIIGKE